VLQAAPIKVFLSFMSVEGSMEGLRRGVRGVRMLQQIDDHTDVIHFTLPQPLVRHPTCGRQALAGAIGGVLDGDWEGEEGSLRAPDVMVVLVCARCCLGRAG
jgi:hypothetical protein